MKRFFVFALSLALVAIFALGAGAAERKGMIGVGVGAGVGLPLGTFKDGAKMGWKAGAGAGYFATDQVALGVEGTYSQHKAQDALIVAPVTDAKTQLIEFGAWVRYFFKMQNEKVSPYVKFGVGAASIKDKVTPDSLSSGTSETFMGANIGAGAMFAVSPTASIFGEVGLYDYAKKNFPPLNYVAVKAGVAFMFGGSGGGSGATQ